MNIKKILLYISDFILYLIFLIFITVFKFLPAGTKLKFSEAVGIVLFHIIPKGKRLTYRNLNLILNEQGKLGLSRKEIKEIAINSYKNTAKSFLLPFWIYEYMEKYPPVVYNSELLKNMTEKYEKLIITIPHFGFFHVNMYPVQNEPLFILVRPIPNKFIQDYIDRHRFKENMRSFPESHLRTFLKSRDVKGIFVTANDVRKPVIGEKVDFFGMSTTASGFTAYFSIKKKLPVIMMYNIVDKNNICHIHIEEILYPENYSDRLELSNALMKIYERIILKNPDQWYWFQERWKEFEQ